MSKPIFIIGCPRFGTTITLKIMARHEEFTWVSSYLNIFSSRTSISGINRIYDLPYIGSRLYVASTQKQNSRLLPDRIRRYSPVRSEPCNFWNAYLSKFQWERGRIIPLRCRTVSDISEEVINIGNIIKSVCKYQGKSIFLSKDTDFPRIQFLTKGISE